MIPHRTHRRLRRLRWWRQQLGRLDLPAWPYPAAIAWHITWSRFTIERHLRAAAEAGP